MPDSVPSSEVLIAAALRYVEMGFSVLPLIGGDDPELAKQAAVKWTEYQARHPRPDEIENWFGTQGFRGLGLITGPISRLAALDFDITRLIDRFAETNPKLIETLRIPTRRGCHLHLRTLRNDHFRNRKLNGVEFRYEGRYLVAPPTVIAGHEYTAVGREKPIFLTQSNWLAIQRFMDEVERDQKVTVSLPHPPAPSPYMERRNQQEVVEQQEALQRLYRKIAREEGRNEALFAASLAARDGGWSQAYTENTLLFEFVHTLPVTHHHAERPERRQREGKATITSAFSRPPRSRRFETPQLDTAIREALLARNHAPLLRALEGLRLKGIQPGQTFNRQQALIMLAGIVGRDAVDAALKTSLDGQPIFALAPALSEPLSPQIPANAARTDPVHHQKNAGVCLTKSGKTRGGRPARHYTMPDNAHLRALLGVTKTSSDPLDEADLRSSKAVRQAMHRELIKRRPSTYTVQWLAARVSVSERELRRYNKAIENLHSAPTFYGTPITWDNLNEIPNEGSNGPGWLLRDHFGKCYPAEKPLAKKLMGRGYHLTLLRQAGNSYWYGEVGALVASVRAPSPRVQTRIEYDPISTPFSVHVQRLIKLLLPRWEAQQEASHANAQKPETQKPDTKQDVPTKPLEVKPRPEAEPLRLKPSPGVEATASPPPPPKQRPKPPGDARRFWHPLDHPDDEWLAQKIYDTVNRLTINPQYRVSMASARRWVDEYGERLVRMALDRLERRAHAIEKPAGFVKTVLRSTKKFEHVYFLSEVGQAAAHPYLVWIGSPSWASALPNARLPQP